MDSSSLSPARRSSVDISSPHFFPWGSSFFYFNNAKLKCKIKFGICTRKVLDKNPTFPFNEGLFCCLKDEDICKKEISPHCKAAWMVLHSHVCPVCPQLLQLPPPPKKYGSSPAQSSGIGADSSHVVDLI